jgi:hypothetical protein
LWARHPSRRSLETCCSVAAASVGRTWARCDTASGGNWLPRESSLSSSSQSSSSSSSRHYSRDCCRLHNNSSSYCRVDASRYMDLAMWLRQWFSSNRTLGRP